MDQPSKGFLQLTTGLITFFIIGALFVFGLYFFLSIQGYQIFLVILGCFFIFCILGLVTMTLFFLKLYQRRKVIGNPDWYLIGIKFLYPFLDFICCVIGLSLSSLQDFFIQINNLCIQEKNIKLPSEKILILTPHCLQKSTCSIKVTHDPSLCQKCGQCNIQDLVAIKHKYQTQLVVATGGTLARQAVQDYRPQLIIAIACERDLISGIMDIPKIPVVGIYNERPQGPCKDTYVNIFNLEEWIKKVTIY